MKEEIIIMLQRQFRAKHTLMSTLPKTLCPPAAADSPRSLKNLPRAA